MTVIRRETDGDPADQASRETGTHRGVRPRRGPWSLMLSPAQAERAAARLDEGPVPAGPEDPALPHVVYVMADRGRTEEALSLAASLLRLDLDALLARHAGDVEAVVHLTDIVVARLWLTEMAGAADPAAVATAASLLAPDVDVLDPRRRALLRLFLAGTAMGAPDASDADLSTAQGHLSAVLEQARLLGFVPLEVIALAGLALLKVPSCDLEAARELAATALERGSAAEPATAGTGAATGEDRTTMALWQFVATAVEQWACYYQGRPTDPLALAQLEQHLARYSFYPVASLVATTVVAAQHAQHGSMPRARSLLHTLLATPRFRRLGVWRVFPLVADAYLAIISGDDNRVRDRERDLFRAGAPGEQLLIHAALLAAAGDAGGALQALHGVTSSQVSATGLTFPVACALEGMLYEQTGDSGRADRSIRQAIGAAEPYGARRVLSAHDPAVMVALVRRAADARPADRWTRDILSYLEADLARTDPPQRIVVPGTTPAAERDLGERGATVDLAPLPSPLTAREVEVLTLVSQGASQAQIARELYVSPNTVKTHLRSIRAKLGAERTGEAVALARSARWLAP